MASIGIGGAKVETELDVDPNGVSAGEVIQGRFRVEGGKVEQEIDDIEIQLCCNYFVEKEVEDNTVIETRTHILAKQELEFDKKLEPGESKEIPFSIRIPVHTPRTIGKHKVWISTKLEIENAIDASDKDYINILPDPVTAAGFAALDQLGFRLKEITQMVGSMSGWPLPFVLEYEFKPGGDFSDLDEIEVMFFPRESGTLVHLEIDKKAKGLGGFFADAMDLDESRTSFTITHEDAADIEALAERFSAIIKQAM